MILNQPQLLALLLILPVMVAIWLWRGRRLAPLALLFRLLTVALLILAATNPTIEQTTEPATSVIILVDQSGSLTAEGQAALRSQASRIASKLTGSTDDAAAEEAAAAPDTATILWFGGEVVAPGQWSDPAIAPDPPPTLAETLNPTASDIGGALQLARELLTRPTSEQATDTAESESAAAAPQQVVLLSDGIETRGDALAEAQRLAEAGISVHVLPQEAVQDPLWLERMAVEPHLVRAGEAYSVHIVAANSSDAPMQATLQLWEDGELAQEEPVTLEPGNNDFSLTGNASSEGIKRLRAEVIGQPDTFAENNSAATTMLVAPRPSVLIVEGRSGEGSDLALALLNAGIESETIAPEQLASRPSELRRYDGMLLVDVPSHKLTYDQMANVEGFVGKDGHGLVIVGGTNAYGLGAYEDTPLEQVAPVLMQPEPNDQRPDVALLLILDRSASMTVSRGVSKLDMAKEAAILSTETLQEEDSLGVLAFDTRQQWTVPLQRIGEGLELSQIRDTIARLASGGGTDIYGALEMGLNDLMFYPASVRHVVLLSDGRSYNNDMVAYQQLIDAARAEQITLSTIAIGFDSDTQLLNQLADWGNGRYYFAEDAEDIPQLTLRESEIASSDPTIEGEFVPQAPEPHPLLRNLELAGMPSLNGYVATTEKETADVVLRSPNSDPVLTSWQYGLGRAVAWTPSFGEPWAEAWLTWEGSADFWSTMVRYTLPDPQSTESPMSVRFEPQPDSEETRIIVEAVQRSGEPYDRADVYARITLPNGTERDIGLRQVGPGRYVQELVLPTSGAYGVWVQINSEDGGQENTQVGYVHQPAAEYAPLQDAAKGRQLLQAIAATTGGEEIDQAWVPTAEAATEADAQEASESRSLRAWLLASLRAQLWLWLLGAALLTWLLEIAVRRGMFGGRR